jgi:hypothetical protein
VLRAAEFRHGHSSLSRFLTPDLSVQPGLGRLPLPTADQLVTDPGDSGLSTQLRHKIDLCQSVAPVGGTITFNVAAPVTLNPANGPLPTITTNVTINGGGTVEISGNNGTRIFNVNTGATLTLKSITISHAYSAGADGGAVANVGTLNTDHAKFLNNATSPSWSGSAILSWGGR